MVIDSSAVLAILFAEPEAIRFAKVIEAADSIHISAGSYVESGIVFDNRADAVARREFDRFFQLSGILIEPVTVEQARMARQAHHDFGKGRHRAGLNFGDCLSYALAKALDQPLLFKGDDFPRTDVRSAL